MCCFTPGHGKERWIMAIELVPLWPINEDLSVDYQWYEIR
jgi:hypothetical protein